MTQMSAAARSTSPSLFKLVSSQPEEHRLRHPADALVVICRQLELVIQEENLAADLAIGTLRHSLFRLHQGRIAQLAPICRSITVYGEADVEPPEIPGVKFVNLEPGTPLCNEWFMVVDSPTFWGALLTRAAPDRSKGTVRRYLFEGTLSPDERVASRANLLLSLIQRQPAPDIGPRDPFLNRARWARVAYNLATHSEAERLELVAALRELPELHEIVSHYGPEQRSVSPLDNLVPLALEALNFHCRAAGAILYHYEGQQLHPLVWNGLNQPYSLALQDGISGQAFQRGELVLAQLYGESLEPAERDIFTEAQSVAAVPLAIEGQIWGVLTVGLVEAVPTESKTPLSAVGVAVLLEQILAAHGFQGTTAQLEQPQMAAQAQPQAPSPAPQAPPPVTRPSSSPSRPISAPPPPSSPGGFGKMPSWMQATAPEAAAANRSPAFPPTAAFPSSAPGARGNNPGGQALPFPSAASSPGAFGAPALSGGSGGFASPAAPPKPNSWPQGNQPGFQVAGNVLRPPTAPAAPRPAFKPSEGGEHNQKRADLQRRLKGALVAFDQRAADEVWDEACNILQKETMLTELLTPVQIAIGEGWHRGEVSVVSEHFVSRFVEGKLLNLLNAGNDDPQRPLALIGCVQGEMHEIGAIMLALFMRWGGFRVIYLGQNVPNTAVKETVEMLQPKIVGLSSSTIESAHNLTEVGQIIHDMPPPRPQFVFGGIIFAERPDMVARIQGQYLEGDMRSIVRTLVEKLI